MLMNETVLQKHAINLTVSIGMSKASAEQILATDAAFGPVEFHEASNIFPVSNAAVRELANDIRANGQRNAIETIDGKIIDGRQRYLACKMAGVKPQCIEIEIDDPVGYVLSRNLQERKLDQSQLAMVAARLMEYCGKHGIDGQKFVPQSLGHIRRKRDMFAVIVGASSRCVGYAQHVLKTGIPSLIAAVDDRRIGITIAGEIALQPADVQQQRVDNPAPARRFVRKNNKDDKDLSQKTENKEDGKGIRIQGVGVMHAHEAINCLRRIPKNDALRKRAFQLVTDWIKYNQ